jgi:hypothetical protein
MGLSEPVAAALDAAVATVKDLVYELADAERHEGPSLIKPKIQEWMEEGAKP